MSLGKEIYRSHDDFGPIRVCDNGSKRFLTFGDEREQSCQLKANPQHLQHEYNRAMLLVLLFLQPRDVIILGLGGGSLANCLHHHYDDLQLRVVELRRLVIKIAHRYFHLPKCERLEVIHQDAAEFIDQPDTASTDLLMSDLYTDDGLELMQLQAGFIERCQQLLNDDGWLVLNCWIEHRQEQELLNALNQQFTTVLSCTTDCGNWVVLASNQTVSMDELPIKQAAKRLSQQLGFSLATSLERLQQHHSGAVTEIGTKIR